MFFFFIPSLPPISSFPSKPKMLLHNYKGSSSAARCQQVLLYHPQMMIIQEVS